GSFASVASKDRAYSLQFNGHRLELTLFRNTSNPDRIQAPDGAIAPGQTYHVVGTYDGSVARLFVNASEVASKTLTGAIVTNANDVRIGSWNGQGEFLQGTIQEVAVYGHALSAARVQDHYAAGTHLRSSDTALTCSPAPATVGRASTCTATVSDSDVGAQWTPEGPVDLASDGPGWLSAPSCMLSGSGGRASCTVTYTPSDVGAGTHTLSASFVGDGFHSGSAGSTGLAVSNPPASAPPAGTLFPLPQGKPGGAEPSAGQAIGIGTAVFATARDWSFPTGVRVRCLASSGCRVNAAATAPLAAVAAARPRLISVGTASLRLGRGRATLVRIRLLARGRRALARQRRLRVKVVVTVTASRTRPVSLARMVTVRAPGTR
ncbi:MAG: hypothetical protein M3155_04645, partial [Actinomycetota bacterium]|nr:hypothetical protein [Actinomycetota bacterium]